MSDQVGMRARVVETDDVRWLFGWNQDLLSFFLTKIDKTTEGEDPVMQLGLRPREIPDEQGLFILAKMAGLEIPEKMLVALFQDKDHQRHEVFVLCYPGELGSGFKTDSLTHAEILKDALQPAQPDRELSIRRLIEYA